ncbi:hypothetical protein [Nonomuraea sp. KM90]|uniref:hypothetical protein n=1 Tax=Nonomuraea sp. KM90 TaxID=3457428 RepID=UPI003FCE30A5
MLTKNQRAVVRSTALIVAIPLTGCAGAAQSSTAAQPPAQAAPAQAPATAAQEPPRNGAANTTTDKNLKQFEWFAGSWTCKSENTPPMGKPYTSTLKATGAYELSGRWFVWNSQEQPGPQVENPVAFKGVWGYDTTNKRVVTNHFDSTGIRALQFGVGWKGNVLDLTDGELFLQNSPPIPFREIFTRLGPDRFTDDMLFKLDGKWQRIIIADCTRDK